MCLHFLLHLQWSIRHTFLPLLFIYIFLLCKFLVVSSLKMKNISLVCPLQATEKKKKKKTLGEKSHALELATPMCGAKRKGNRQFPRVVFWSFCKPTSKSPCLNAHFPRLLLKTSCFPVKAEELTPGHSFASLQGCKVPLALSRDMKEGCLMLNIKLISCQDLTQPQVTTIDMSKPYKKNKHVWCKESFVFDAR